MTAGLCESGRFTWWQWVFDEVEAQLGVKIGFLCFFLLFYVEIGFYFVLFL